MVEQIADASEPVAADGARVVVQGSGVGVVFRRVDPPRDQS